ncbi:phage tail tape measure protein [Chitinimonas sp. PSY-7]|uniref:phage tail tape measure protein n=1 Tax=Chitinimonas sp. PSY-7 TaxID=3459088 RepID=UPI004040301F
MSDQKLKLQVLFAAVDKLTAPLKGIGATSRDAANKVNAMRQQLKGLNAQQSAVDTFNKLTQRARDSTEALQKAKGKLAEYQEKTKQAREAQAALVGKVETARRAHMMYVVQMAAGNDKHAGFGYQMYKSKEALEKLESEFRAAQNASRNFSEKAKLAGKQVRHLAAEHRALSAPLRDAAVRLKEAGINARQLGEHQSSLAQKISQANAALAAQEAKLKAVNERMRQAAAARAQYDKAQAMRNNIAGNSAAMLGAGVVAGRALMTPVSAYASAEDASTGLRVAMMGQGGKVKQEYADIVALAEKLGDRLPGTTADFQEMMTMLTRQGISAKAILGGVGEATAYLGVQLKLPYAQAAEYAAKLQDATGALEQDMMGVMDTIQRTFYVGVDTSNMVSAFSKLGPALDLIKQKGLSGAKAMAPLLAMADQTGLVGESAGNAFRKVFQRSMDAKSVGKGNELLQGSGIKLDFTNGKGGFGSLEQMFKQLDKLKQLTDEKRLALIKEVWGDDAETQQALKVMIDGGAEGYAEMLAKMAEQASLQERVNEQLGTLKNLWDAASGTFTNALVAFGEAIAPELKALTEWIGDVSERLKNWAKDNPELSNTIMKTAAVAAVLLTAVGALGLAVAAVLGPLAIARLSVGMLGVQMSGGLRVLGMLGGALKWFGGALLKVGSIARVVFAFLLANPWIALATALAGAAIYIATHWEKLGPMFASLWAGFKSGAVAAFDWVVSKTLSVVQGMFSVLRLFSPLYWVIRYWDEIKGFMISLPSQFMTLGGQIIDGLINGISARWGALKSTFASLGDALPGWLRTKLDIHSPSRVFAQIGQYTMQGLEAGIDKHQQGPLASMLALSKQLTTPLAASVALGASVLAPAAPVRIDSRPPLARSTAPVQAAPVSINITVNAAPGMDERKLAQLVAQEIAKHQRSVSAAKRSRLSDAE